MAADPVPRAPSSDDGHAAHHGSIVPAYPYNVAMAPSAFVGGPLPDDSEVTTRLPSICVDYLSHDWAEDDVWTSWKAMTRHKTEIANGVRLENASWRTWAKQRGNLKTVSPETLNWSVSLSLWTAAVAGQGIDWLCVRLPRRALFILFCPWLSSGSRIRTSHGCTDLSTLLSMRCLRLEKQLRTNGSALNRCDRSRTRGPNRAARRPRPK